jgi:CelD/BcsL family acetyltransferase involved in cellulose biosynthesis
VADAIRDWLIRRDDRVVDFHGLREDARLASCVGTHHARLVDETAPFLALPPDWPTLLASRSSRVRNTVKRTAKRLTREGVTQRTIGAEDAGRALDDLERLHDLRWGAGSSFLADYDRFRRAASAGMARGELVVHELVAGGETIASMAVMRLAGRASFYQSGRRTEPEWRGAGTIVFTDAVAAAIEAGCHEFDLLRGGETYKSDWSSGERDVVRLIGTAGRRRLAAASVAGEANARRWLRPRVHRALEAASEVRTRLRSAR